MKVFVQIVDTHSGISQHGMIEEPIQKGFEVANAINHFGTKLDEVEWIFEQSSPIIKIGKVEGTSKIVTAITILVVSDQPSRPGENRSVIGATLNKIEKTERHQWQNVQDLNWRTTLQFILKL